MNVTDMWNILKRDYGIQTMDDLETALRKNQGINIGLFTEGAFTKGGNHDTERVPGEAECRATA